MKPYSVEIFRPDFTMVGNTNVNEVIYKEDYLTSDENTITVLALPGIEKQDFIRYGLERSVIDTGVTPTAEDTIITLSTCSGGDRNTRWVVQAVSSPTN